MTGIGRIELVARRVGRDDDLAHAPVRRRVRVGHRHHDPEGGALGGRREPLVAVDHPLVAVLHGASSAARSGRPRTPRARSSRRTSAPSPSTSGRRKRSFCSSVPNMWRISPFPASGAWQLKTSCAHVLRPISSFRQRVLDEAGARAARLGREVRRPDPGRLCLGAQLGDQRVGRLVLARQRSLVRIDVLLHERPHLRAALARPPA